MSWTQPRRPLAPGKEDFRKWRRLVREARAAAAKPLGPGGDLRAAAATACRAVAPSWELQAKLTSPLIRLAETWPVMDGPTRAANAERLKWLADRLAEAVGAPEAKPSPALAEAREPRRDIFG